MSYIIIVQEIEIIINFLDKNIKIVDEELSDIFKRKDAGEFCNYLEEFENECYISLECEKIAIRAVFNELNALIEWVLCGFAVLPKEKYSKNMKIKLVYDMPISEVCSSIEQKYSIKLDILPGFKRLKAMRKKINAFKHRKGFKDFRKNEEFKKGKTVNVLERYELNRKEAYQTIEDAKIFIKSFWDELDLWPDLKRFWESTEGGYIDLD
jgi:tRNA U38,U39,U40 pseudouridine synthase TruA